MFYKPQQIKRKWPHSKKKVRSRLCPSETIVDAHYVIKLLMDSDTDRRVASLNLLEVLNNYNT